MIGFAVLVNSTGSDNAAILQVLYVDYVGIFFLCSTVILKSMVINNQARSNT